MATNKGMVCAIEELAKESKYDFKFVTHQDAILAGAIGAGLLAGYRYLKLKENKIMDIV